MSVRDSLLFAPVKPVLISSCFSYHSSQWREFAWLSRQRGKFNLFIRHFLAIYEKKDIKKLRIE